MAAVYKADADEEVATMIFVSSDLPETSDYRCD
jgi:hypothetical protein